MSKQDTQSYKSAETRTKCICPKCGKIHYIKMFYTGAGTPKKYCQLCILYVRKYDFNNDSIYA